MKIPNRIWVLSALLCCSLLAMTCIAQNTDQNDGMKPRGEPFKPQADTTPTPPEPSGDATRTIPGFPREAEVCVECHGLQGEGQPGLAPRIAGLPVEYFRQQVHGFQVGKRNNNTMHVLAEEVTDPVLDKIASYFSSRPLPKTTPILRGSQAVFQDPAARLAYQGDWSREIPACVTCHGASGIGSGNIPPLAGQHAGYIKTQLQDWKKGERTTDQDKVMTKIASQLSNSEIEGLAEYFANIGSAEAD
ncbi:c-type cytochrome [Microbulbifer elongatus]|uniref:C-type cytochrome n=1 Tax=Microbulbifer elongatus TaxID=86173 RepID=A0ABT1NX68_9GAMM|nr:c-type cytochrome [Microbulbifer elongatus]MCQ3828470.1 c-type cytochrome [Microbulbifer elongatus]